MRPLSAVFTLRSAPRWTGPASIKLRTPGASNVVEVAQHQDAVPHVSLHDPSQLRKPGVARRNASISVMIDYMQCPPTGADCDLEDDTRLGRRRGVEAVSSDFCQRPSRQDGETVVPFVPLDAGGEDVMKTKGSGQDRRLVHETGATQAYVDFLQRDDVGLHGLQFGGDRIQRCGPRGADVPGCNAGAVRRASNRRVTRVAGRKRRMSQQVGRLGGDSDRTTGRLSLSGPNTILSGNGEEAHSSRARQSMTQSPEHASGGSSPTTGRPAQAVRVVWLKPSVGVKGISQASVECRDSSEPLPLSC